MALRAVTFSVAATLAVRRSALLGIAQPLERSGAAEGITGKEVGREGDELAVRRARPAPLDERYERGRRGAAGQPLEAGKERELVTRV
jgi:hypothetical protein